MSHWFDEINRVSYYIEQVVNGNEKFEQDKFVEAIKIVQEGFSVCHDYAHVAGKAKGISDNPDHSCHGKGVWVNAKRVYKHATEFNKNIKKSD